MSRKKNLMSKMQVATPHSNGCLGHVRPRRRMDWLHGRKARMPWLLFSGSRAGSESRRRRRTGRNAAAARVAPRRDRIGRDSFLHCTLCHHLLVLVARHDISVLDLLKMTVNQKNFIFLIFGEIGFFSLYKIGLKKIGLEQNTVRYQNWGVKLCLTWSFYFK